MIQWGGPVAANVATNFAGQTFSVPANPVTVVEFYNAALDHYFITADSGSDQITLFRGDGLGGATLVESTPTGLSPESIAIAEPPVGVREQLLQPLVPLVDRVEERDQRCRFLYRRLPAVPASFRWW